jgi:hypothetical protein
MAHTATKYHQLTTIAMSTIGATVHAIQTQTTTEDIRHATTTADVLSDVTTDASHQYAVTTGSHQQTDAHRLTLPTR